MDDELKKKIDSIFQQALSFTDRQERVRFVIGACEGDEYVRREVLARYEELEQKIDAIFQQAVDFTDRQERERFVTEVCAGNEYLYKRVSTLLVGRDRADDFLNLDPIFPGVLTFALKQGDRLGLYEIIQHVASGGMGEVYLARDRGPLRRAKVALKILPKSFAENPEMIDRFQREARAASVLNHPNILTIYDFGRTAEHYYIVSEFVEGVSLRERIGKLTIKDAVEYARQIAQALERAHSEGIVHRDLKPDNIMVRPDGFLKILDFGIAKAISLQQTTIQGNGYGLAAAARTQPGLAVGTVNYMSPEQARGQEVDARTDVWSWGVVLYEMLAGRRPFEASAPEALISAIKIDPKPPSRNKELNRIVARALRDDPKNRFQNMAEVHKALEDLPKDNHVLHFWRIAAAVVVILAGVIVFRWPKHRPLPARTTIATGHIVSSAISSDGKYVAYASEDAQGQALKIRQIGHIEFQERVPPAHGQYLGITFSRDGSFIYYVFQQGDGPGKLFKIPVLVGSPSFVTDSVDSPISFAPSELKFAFVRYDREKHATSLVVRTMNGNEEWEFAAKQIPESFWPNPLWSLDGNSIVCGVFVNDPKSGKGTKIVSIDLKTGREHVITDEPWTWIGKMAWVHQGSALAVLARSINANSSQLLEVSWPNGEVSNITGDSDAYLDLDGSSDGQTLVVLVARWKSNIELTSLSNPGNERLLVEGRYFGISWTPDGKIISQTAAGGHPDLWSIDPNNQDSHQLTDDPFVKQTPVASSDGRYLVYVSNRGRTFHLWRSTQEGLHPIQLTFDTTNEENPAITPDSRWVFYNSSSAGYDALWKVAMNGGVTTQFTFRPHRAANPSISPNGKWVACDYADASGNGSLVSILDAATGGFKRSFPDIPVDAPRQWSPARNELLYVAVQSGIANIWAQPIDGGKPRPRTHFTSAGYIPAFAVAPNKDSLAYVRRVGYSDLDLMTY